MFLSAVFPGFSLVLVPRGYTWRPGSACEKFEDVEVVYWVNVSESFDARLSRRNGR